MYVPRERELADDPAASDMFHDWEIYPASPWKYGLVADTSFEVLEQDMVRQPFLAKDAPVRVKVKGQLIRDWKMEGNNAETLRFIRIRTDSPLRNWNWYHTEAPGFGSVNSL